MSGDLFGRLWFGLGGRRLVLHQLDREEVGQSLAAYRDTQQQSADSDVNAERNRENSWEPRTRGCRHASYRRSTAIAIRSIPAIRAASMTSTTRPWATSRS